MLGDGVDVGLQRKGDDVGLEPIDHGAGLLSGAAVRHADGDALAGLGGPVGGEGFVELFVEFAGRVVGDVEDRGVGVGCRDEGGHRDEEGGAEPCEEVETRSGHVNLHIPSD